MDEQLDQPLTDIEQSRADTGFRYYVVQPDVYTGLAAAVDADRGYPNKQGTTLTGLPPVDSLAEATDGSGKLIAIDCWRFTANDDAMLEGTSGVQELTQLEFLSIKPQPTEDLP
jgi:hypothetical protein